MRVLLDCRMLGWTGVGRYTEGLTRALVRCPDLDCVLALPTGGASPVADEAAESIEVPGHPFSPAGALALGRAVSRVAPDVTHCLHFPIPFPAPECLVVTLHDLIPLVVPGVMGPARKLAYRALNARAVRAASAIVTISQTSRRDITRVFGRAEGKIRVISPAVDDFSQGPIGGLPEGLSDAGRPWVLAMGSTRPHKGLKTVLDAFGVIANRFEGASLVLVGDVQRDRIPLSAGLPQDRVLVTGYVDDPQLRRLFSEADVFVFPSEYEGFGLPPLEAMSMGCPVVASDAASLTEVVGEAALTVPPGQSAVLAEAACRVLSDEELARSMRAAGRQRAAEFTWARAAAQVAGLYEEICSVRCARMR